MSLQFVNVCHSSAKADPQRARTIANTAGRFFDMGKFLCEFKSATMTISHHSKMLEAWRMASSLCLGVIRGAVDFLRLEKSAPQYQTDFFKLSL